MSLISVFGMHEMEIAAEEILKLQEGREEGQYTPLYVTSFSREEAQTGFIELIYGGFMEKQAFRPDMNVYTYNGGFVPNKAFFNRIQNRVGSKRETASFNVGLRRVSAEDESLLELAS